MSKSPSFSTSPRGSACFIAFVFLSLPFFATWAGTPDAVEASRELRQSDPRVAIAFLGGAIDATSDTEERFLLRRERASLLRRLGEYERALADAQAVVEKASALDDRSRLAQSLRLKATIHAEMGDFGDAINYLLEARRLLTGRGDTVNEANVLLALGVVYTMLGEDELSADYTRRCDLAQGYLWSRPVPAAQVRGLMESIGKSSKEEEPVCIADAD